MNLLTVQEVREKLKVSQACVYALIESGDLQHLRIGIGRGTIRVDEADLESFIESRKRGARTKKFEATSRAAFVHLDASKLKDAWSSDEPS